MHLQQALTLNDINNAAERYLTSTTYVDHDIEWIAKLEHFSWLVLTERKYQKCIQHFYI